jgi:uncharacterized membrane protein
MVGIKSSIRKSAIPDFLHNSIHIPNIKGKMVAEYTISDLLWICYILGALITLMVILFDKDLEFDMDEYDRENYFLEIIVISFCISTVWVLYWTAGYLYILISKNKFKF